jgi:predicted short-subunit dehydrogenase-like oxidoreductase (DUF2520 family)
MGKALQELGMHIEFLASRTPEHARSAAEFIGCGTMPVSLGDLIPRASHVLIAVSDNAIEPVARELARERGSIRVALHTCGSYGPELLEPLNRIGVSCGSIHPLQTITDGTRGAIAVRGCAFAISGDDEAAAWAKEIAQVFGGEILHIRPDARHLYHASAVMASNYLAAILDTAQELMGLAGISEAAALRALAPLARTSLENALTEGPVKALTGPVVRGDASTIAAHTLALERSDDSARQLYRAAGLRALRMARERGLPEHALLAVQRALSGGN